MTQMMLPNANGLSAQCHDDALLTLADVAKQTGWNVERLRVYTKQTPLNQYVGARPKPGSKGVGYPPDSLPFFAKLLADANANKVVPSTLAGWLTRNFSGKRVNR